MWTTHQLVGCVKVMLWFLTDPREPDNIKPKSIKVHRKEYFFQKRPMVSNLLICTLIWSEVETMSLRLCEVR